MNIREFINECEKIAAKYGDECEVRGWGDEAASIGIEAMKKVGVCKTSDWKKSKDWNEEDGNRWSEMCNKFGACTSSNTKDGNTEFFAMIDNEDAMISL